MDKIAISIKEIKRKASQFRRGLFYVVMSFIILILISVKIGEQYFEFNSTANKLQQIEYGKPVIVTLAWNNRIYEVTQASMPSNEIGTKIGSVTHQVSPKPEANGEIARNTSEGSPILHGSGNSYQILGVNQNNKIALERSEGHFYICEYFCPLNPCGSIHRNGKTAYCGALAAYYSEQRYTIN